MNEFNSIAEEFTSKYLNEYDYKYTSRDVPVNKAFLPDFTEIIEIFATGVASDILKELGSDIYKNIKGKLTENYMNKYKNAINRPYILLKKGDFQGIRTTITLPQNKEVLVLKGEDRDTTIIQAGKLRPLIKIGKGSFLILMDITIEYDDFPEGLIDEETAPSFFPINTIFRKRSN